MKRLICITLAVVCFFLLTSTAVFAEGSELSTLTVVMQYGDQVLPGQGIAICRVATLEGADGRVSYVAVQDFTDAGADFANLTTEQSITLAANLNTYASVHNISRSIKTTESDGSAVFSDLPAGLYLIAQSGSGVGGYIFAPYFVELPGYDESVQGGRIYDLTVYPKVEPVKKPPGTETISVSVYKLWEGTDSPPGAISVQLYRNGSPYGNPVSLDTGNYWNYTWYNLSPHDTWTVDEYPVPSGYTKVITGNVGTGFIITNKRAPTESPTPPVTPPPPVTSPPPVEPVETPNIPIATPPEETVETPDIPIAPPPIDKPKTEDSANLPLWVALIIASSLGLAAVVSVSVIKHKRRG